MNYLSVETGPGYTPPANQITISSSTPQFLTLIGCYSLGKQSMELMRSPENKEEIFSGSCVGKEDILKIFENHLLLYIVYWIEVNSFIEENLS